MLATNESWPMANDSTSLLASSSSTNHANSSMNSVPATKCLEFMDSCQVRIVAVVILVIFIVFMVTAIAIKLTVTWRHRFDWALARHRLETTSSDLSKLGVTSSVGQCDGNKCIWPTEDNPFMSPDESYGL